MTRRVPWLAPVVGLIIAVPAGIYAALLGPDTFSGALVTVGLFCPFAVYAVVHAEGPSRSVLPRTALAAAVTVGLALFVHGTLASGEVLLGVFAGLLVAVPAGLYHARHGERSTPLSPDATLVVGGAIALSVLLAGVVLARTFVLAVVDAALVSSLAMIYRQAELASRRA